MIGETGERKSAVATPDGKSRKKKKCVSRIFQVDCYEHYATHLKKKMTTHHKACTLPAVHSSISKPASRMFRQNSKCNWRLTTKKSCSPNRMDLTKKY